MFYSTIFGVLIIIINVFTLSFSARIFCLFPVPAFSHQIVYRGYIEELAKNGHQIVVATPRPLFNNNPNITEIDLRYAQTLWNNNFNYDNMRDINLVSTLMQLIIFFKQLINYILTEPEVVKNFEKQEEPFDLMVVEFFGEVINPLKSKLNIPMIGIQSMDMQLTSHKCIGNYYHVQSFSDTLFSDVLIPKNFMDRFRKFVVSGIHLFVYQKYAGMYKNMMSDLLNIDSLGSENTCDVDLVFACVHPALGNVMPVVPTYIDISGIHLKPLKPLPTEIKTFIDEAQNGVILFSFGSCLNIENLNKDIKASFLEAFSEIPYRVIMKENNSNIVLPSNVRSFSWLPQRDILNHPNVKLIILQGGYQSYFEAVTHAVPMLVVPFVLDQELNAQRIQVLEIGKHLDINHLTKDIIKENILSVVTSKIYKENIVRLSKQLFDSPQTPLERAVWWTEYVLRHNGTKHLRSLQNPPTFIELFNLDIIAFIFTIFIFLNVFLYLILKKIWRLVSRRSYDAVKKNT